MPATIAKGSDYFQVITYTGNGGTNAITGLSFQPDFVWIKGRSGATDHALYDAVRGSTKDLVSNSTAAETTQSTGLVSFDSNGFTLGALSKVNTNGATYVAWCWKAGSSTVTNTSGSISSQVRANPTAGVSIVTWTANGANHTVGHGLGIAPKMIVAKSRSGAGTFWMVGHSSIGWNQYVHLNATNAATTNNNIWQNTTPTSAVFSIGVDGTLNTNNSQNVAYCFAEVAGFSKFGSYTGNGSTDGPFVYLGFRPRFVLIKNASVGTTDWILYDTVRSTYNVLGDILKPNTSGVETGGNAVVDALSNGFKLRNTFADHNGSGNTIIYMAFAESPFNYSNSR